jgi:hypothetical protein
MVKLFAYCILILISFPIIAQVNIERYRSSDVNGKLDEYESVLNIHANIQRSTNSQYKVGLTYVKPFLIESYANGFFISNMNYGERNGEEYVNNMFVHIRLIEKSDHSIKLETYFQTENNAFTLNQKRTLTGLGIRYKWGAFILGTSILYEWYKEADTIQVVQKERLSQYIQLTHILNAFNTLNTTVYIQPRLSDLDDIRYYSEIDLTTKLSENINYLSSFISQFYNKSNVFDKAELFFKSGIEFSL